jgi:enoyl-CoA hydratase/carnithine racemase
MREPQRLLTTHRGRVLIVEFNNPPRNFFDEAMSIELDALTRALHRDRTIGAVLFTGRDDTYLTHFDVPTLLRGASTTPFAIGYRPARIVAAASRLTAHSRLLDRVARHTAARDIAFLGRIYAALDRLNRSDKVVVTAINGLALGMGCIFALACDVRLIADDTHIGLPESALAIIAAVGGTQRLTRAVGASRALELLLDGRWLTAAQAHELGIAHHVLPREELRDHSYTVAERLARRSPVINREIKRVIYDAGSRPLPAALRREAAATITTMTSNQARRCLESYNRHLASQDLLTDEAIMRGWYPLLEDGVPLPGSSAHDFRGGAAATANTDAT